MTSEDKIEFATIWGGAWAMYGKEATRPIMSMAFESLKAYDIAEVRQGLSKHMQNPDSGQFAPKPADVIKHIGGSTESRALQAWAKVDRAVRGIGPYLSVAFDDPLIHCVIQDMGGWVKLGNGEENDWPFVAREFERRYRAYGINPPANHPKQLVGIGEATNASNGISNANDCVLIGDERRALEVMETGSEGGRLSFTPAGMARISTGKPELLEAK